MDFTSKIVNSSDQCFSSMTCDYNGFVCKKDADQALEKANKSLKAYRSFYICASTAMDMKAVQSCFLYNIIPSQQ